MHPAPVAQAANPLEDAAAERAPVLQRLRKAGLRPTIARIGIYQVIAGAKPFGLSADEVYQRCCCAAPMHRRAPSTG